jgi:hypothetical protein
MEMATDQQAIQSKPVITASTEKDILEEEKESEEEKKSQIALSWKILVSIGAGVIILQAIFWMVVRSLISSWSDRSAFGEMFGGLNTFFSGLAFGGLIYAIYLQSKELRYQRRELKYQRRELRFQRLELELTRNELKRSAETQEKSEEALKKQVDELIHQRRLSVMPGFILYFQQPTDYIPTIMNIGHGGAFNVRLEPIPLTGKWEHYLIFLSPISHISRDQAMGFWFEYLSANGTVDISTTGIDQDTDVKEYLRTKEYEVTITFNDIEGNQYTQKMTMSAGACQPQKVCII